MRKLTLDEKISIKGVLHFKGLTLPKLDTSSAIHFWGMACGGTITKWHMFRNH